IKPQQHALSEVGFPSQMPPTPHCQGTACTHTYTHTNTHTHTHTHIHNTHTRSHTHTEAPKAYTHIVTLTHCSWRFPCSCFTSDLCGPCEHTVTAPSDPQSHLATAARKTAQR